MKISTRQRILAFSIAASLLLTLAGCKKSDTVIYGKVTAVNGSSVTLALGTMGFRSGSGGQNDWRGRQGGQGGQGGAPAGGVSGQTPSMPSGGFSRRGGNFSPLTLTGKTETILITDTSVLKKEERRGFRETSGISSNSTSLASLSDIQTGSILQVTTSSSGKIVSIVIMGFGQRGQGGNLNAASASTAG